MIIFFIKTLLKIKIALKPPLSDFRDEITINPWYHPVYHIKKIWSLNFDYYIVYVMITGQSETAYYYLGSPAPE